MSARQRALGYLTHPVVVVSLVLLVLNDALWKGAGPSWLTGKLSDFAGLVFFPGLLALVFAVLIPRSGRRYAGLAAWWATAIFFAAVKTMPVANHAFVAAVSSVRGPVQVVRDPADVLALAVLPVGWWLWNRVSVPAARTAMRASAGWAVATYAVLATGATSCAVGPAVNRVTLQAGKLFASDNYLISASSDSGLTWSRVEAGSADSLPAYLQPSSSNRYTEPAVTQLCHSAQPEICYRIVSVREIQESRDSGVSWHEAWTESQRDIEHRPVRKCGAARSGAESLAFGDAETPILVVAMGTEGILRHELDGSWQRVSVHGAELLPRPAPQHHRDKGIGRFRVLGWLLFIPIVLLAVVFSPWTIGVILIVWFLRRRRRLRIQPNSYPPGGYPPSGYPPSGYPPSGYPPPGSAPAAGTPWATPDMPTTAPPLAAPKGWGRHER